MVYSAPSFPSIFLKERDHVQAASTAAYWDRSGPSFPDGPWSAWLCLLHTWLAGHLEVRYDQAGLCAKHRLFAATEGITASVDDAVSFKVTFVTFRRGGGIRAIQALNQSPKKGILANLGTRQEKILKMFSKSTNPYKIPVKKEEVY